MDTAGAFPTICTPKYILSDLAHSPAVSPSLWNLLWWDLSILEELTSHIYTNVRPHHLGGLQHKKYHWGTNLGEDKVDVDKFGSPPSYQIFPSRLRMLCAKMCAPDTGCKEGGVVCATCGVNGQHRDETQCQLLKTD